MDFDKLAEDAPEVDPKDPIALYFSLDRKQSHVEPRPAQKLLLSAWAARRDERDLVLKLATGAGKTTTGLVILYSHMLETQRPVMFLCPTNQLVAQVIAEGERCGVQAMAVQGGQEIPPEVLAASAVCVTSVQSVFNARAGRFDATSFYAIVIDDAHSAVEIVRQQFRVAIPRSVELFKQLYGLFRTSLREQSRGTAEQIESNTRSGALEVPYWAWAAQIDTVTKLLTDKAKQEDAAYAEARKNNTNYSSVTQSLPLNWGLIKNILHGCRCFFSEKGVEIAPEVPPVERIAAYEKAKRRIFMSATISDESVLVREMGCDAKAAAEPVELPDAGGLGERMVLVPRLMAQDESSSIKWEELADLCARTAERHAVVVLAPNGDKARKWGSVGAHVVEGSSQMASAITGLRSGAMKFVVFANRYDGLDLPDEACRVLVLDGAPIAYSLMDMVDMGTRGGGSARRRTVMHRIEQGLGRAVRSPSDYAVVLLFGDDLVPLISKAETRAELTEQTRRQIEFGLELAKKVKQSGGWRSEVEVLMNQCLNRDPGWKKAYLKRVRPNAASQKPPEQKQRIAQALAERQAWRQYVANRGTDATGTLRQYLNSQSEGEAKAFLLQRMAWYIRKDDPAQSLQIQTMARELDHQMLTPPAGVAFRKGTSAPRPSATQFVEWLEQFDHQNAAIAAIDDLRARLVFSPDASHDTFEQALCDLGKILGFEARRPDHESREGPDVLWLEGQYAVPLEAKNRTALDSEDIAKHVAGQLMQADGWTRKIYPERAKVVPVSVHPRSTVGQQAIMPEAARVLTPEQLYSLLDAIQAVIIALKRGGDKFSVELVAAKLTEHRLSLSAILTSRTVKPT